MPLSSLTPLPDYPDPDTTDFPVKIGPWAASLGNMTDELNDLVTEVNGGQVTWNGGTVTNAVTQVRAATDGFWGFYNTGANAGLLAGFRYRPFDAGSYVALYGYDKTGGNLGEFARYDPAGTTTSSVYSIVTKEKGNALYAPISSDETLKQSVVDMDDVGAVIDGLRPRTYEWIVDATDPRPAGTRFGMVAQEVEEVFPEGVLPAGGGLLGLDPLSLIALLVKEVQSLRARDATKDALIADLLSRVVALEP